MAAAPPTVSIVTATYNRSNALRFTVASVIGSSFADWEMLVVGDACTDDTADVVASFDDPRVRFINLPKNIGEQSGPNNEGMRRARGRYIAFLNHDDLYTPDHLATAIENIERTGADLVFAVGLGITAAGRPYLMGLAGNGRYEPHIVAPASLWLFRRELAEEIGPWRFYREIRGVPSQDWLFRAWRAGKDLRQIPRVGVVALQSASRKGVYANREYRENEEYYRRMTTEPDFLARQIARAAVDECAPLHSLKAAPLVRLVLRNIFLRAGLWFRVQPWVLVDLVRLRKRGWFVDHAREIRGLPRLP